MADTKKRKRQNTQTKRGDTKEGAVAGDPVGNAGDQCYKFVVKDERITGKSQMYISGTNDCVYMQSGTASDGQAVFVVCCKKKTIGERTTCKDCDAYFNLVVVPDPAHPNDPKIRRDGTIYCRPAPAPE